MDGHGDHLYRKSLSYTLSASIRQPYAELIPSSTQGRLCGGSGASRLTGWETARSAEAGRLNLAGRAVRQVVMSLTHRCLRQCRCGEPCRRQRCDQLNSDPRRDTRHSDRARPKSEPPPASPPPTSDNARRCGSVFPRPVSFPGVGVLARRPDLAQDPSRRGGPPDDLHAHPPATRHRSLAEGR